MSARLEQLEEVALVLENEGEFHRLYITKATYGQRRSCIGDWIYNRPSAFRFQILVEDRDQLRRYFDERWKLSQTEVNKYEHIPSIWASMQTKEPAVACSFFHAPDQLAPPVQPKEPDMNTAIKITTKTFAGNTDIAEMTDSQIYGLISMQEAEIKGLEAIENKPKRLVAEIEARKAGIAALVAHLDSKV